MLRARARRVPEPPPVAGPWLEDPGFGVYVHIPFCRHRCHYCDFNTYEGQESLHTDYVDALARLIEDCDRPTRPATSVFFGGGTPTLLGAPQLGWLLEAIRGSVGIAPEAEITVEANPETVDEAAFEGLLAAGFNRFSIGVQSLADNVLRALGRTHSAARARDALRAARRAGVRELNADLIYGSPWETTEDWRMSLERLLDEEPDHVSAYALTVEEGTPLATLVATGRVPDVDPDVQADRHRDAEEALTEAGYQRYEISNWARPGRASRHNLLYWCGGDYLGLGAGAHGHVSGRRWWCVARPRDFIARARAGGSVEAGEERLGPRQRAAEAVILGLRLSSGLDLDALARRPGVQVGAELRAVIEQLVAEGLLERHGAWVRLAPRAVLVANEVALRLL